MTPPPEILQERGFFVRELCFVNRRFVPRSQVRERRFFEAPVCAPLFGSAGRISLSRGPKGSLEPSTNLVAGQAAGPLGKPGASQNCPRPYQGESGGLEPAMKPMAGQAAAPLHFLSPLRGPGGLPGQSLATFF